MKMSQSIINKIRNSDDRGRTIKVFLNGVAQVTFHTAFQTEKQRRKDY